MLLVVFARFFALLLALTTVQPMRHSTPIKDPQSLYHSCQLTGVLPFQVFRRAVEGFNTYQPSKSILAVCDFTKPSTEERFFLIDLASQKLILSSLVAHGKNSGELYARSFSNEPESLKTSVGFFEIGSIIQSPKHGTALLLEGLEKGINDRARQREIIMHGADYASYDFIRQHGRLGRSFGCPALPRDVMEKVVPILANGSLLYIFGG